MNQYSLCCQRHVILDLCSVILNYFLLDLGSGILEVCTEDNELLKTII